MALNILPRMKLVATDNLYARKRFLRISHSNIVFLAKMKPVAADNFHARKRFLRIAHSIMEKKL